MTEAEKKTAFNEVSSLYIAQVKQQRGIIARENYNKPKSEDAKQPRCPPEKEAAIIDALRHFGMIEGGNISCSFIMVYPKILNNG